MKEIIKYVLAILSGVITAVPLIIKLIQHAQTAIKEKNWRQVLDLVTSLMVQAETKFATGDERKEWVLMMVKASADTIEYDIDLNVISEMIDSLCAMTHVVNANDIA